MAPANGSSLIPPGQNRAISYDQGRSQAVRWARDRVESGDWPLKKSCWVLRAPAPTPSGVRGACVSPTQVR